MIVEGAQAYRQGCNNDTDGKIVSAYGAGSIERNQAILLAYPMFIRFRGAKSSPDEIFNALVQRKTWRKNFGLTS